MIVTINVKVLHTTSTDSVITFDRSESNTPTPKHTKLESVTQVLFWSKGRKGYWDRWRIDWGYGQWAFCQSKKCERWVRFGAFPSGCYNWYRWQGCSASSASISYLRNTRRTKTQASLCYPRNHWTCHLKISRLFAWRKYRWFRRTWRAADTRAVGIYASKIPCTSYTSSLSHRIYLRCYCCSFQRQGESLRTIEFPTLSTDSEGDSNGMNLSYSILSARYLDLQYWKSTGTNGLLKVVDVKGSSKNRVRCHHQVHLNCRSQAPRDCYSCEWLSCSWASNGEWVNAGSPGSRRAWIAWRNRSSWFEVIPTEISRAVAAGNTDSVSC